MFQGTRTRRIRAIGGSRNPREEEWAWKALAALAIGALLGALAALPYDRLLGLPGTTGTVLRSLVATVVLAGLNAGRVRDLTFDTAATWCSLSTRRERSRIAWWCPTLMRTPVMAGTQRGRGRSSPCPARARRT